MDDSDPTACAPVSAPASGHSCSPGIRSKSPPRFSPLPFSALFWLFFLGSAVGYWIEYLWYGLRWGVWEGHPSTVWGPFSIIYGFGLVAICLLAQALRTRPAWLRFGFYAVFGALVEYAGSLFQEAAFGTRSWDYHFRALNLDGRVSIQMALLWGVLGLAADRLLFPLLRSIPPIPDRRLRSLLLGAASVWMACNLLLTSCALLRWQNRVSGHGTQTGVPEQILDETFPDSWMELRFPNMRFVT